LEERLKEKQKDIYRNRKNDINKMGEEYRKKNEDFSST
jgi:hypothetical protein